RFLRATAKGTVFASENPEAATCIYFDATKALDQAQDKKKAFQDALNVVRDNVRNATRSDDSMPWGSFSQDAWAVNAEYYAKLGIVNPVAEPGENYVSDPEFYKAINDFDEEAVRKQASDYRCDQ